MAVVVMIAAACGQTVTEVEMTPGPMTAGLIANFLATAEGAELAPLFQLRDGHIDLRVNDGAVYALTNIDDKDVATARAICAAVRAASNGPNLHTDFGVINVIGARDATVALCSG
jgi:hypothetical protein